MNSTRLCLGLMVVLLCSACTKEALPAPITETMVEATVSNTPLTYAPEVSTPTPLILATLTQEAINIQSTTDIQSTINAIHVQETRSAEFVRMTADAVIAEESQKQMLQEFIMGIAPFPIGNTYNQTNLISTTSEDNYDTWSTVKCETNLYSRQDSFGELLVFDANATSIWPGALLQGNSVPGGLFTEITLPRNSAIYTINGLPLDQVSIAVPNPTKATVEQAITDLLPNDPIPPTARISFEMEEAYTFEQVMLSLGASAEWMKHSVGGRFDYIQADDKHTLMIKFIQPYYTVSFETPSSPISVFDGVTLQDAQPYIRNGNPPSYISSVTYGRLLFIKATSTHDINAIRAAIQYSYSSFGFEGSIYGAGELENILQEIEFELFAIGGSSEGVIGVITKNELTEYLEQGAQLSRDSTGTPISFRINYLRDNQPFRVNYATSYELANCTSVPLEEPELVEIIVTDKNNGVNRNNIGDREDIYIYAVYTAAPKGTKIQFEIDQLSGEDGPSCVLIDDQVEVLYLDTASPNGGRVRLVYFHGNHEWCSGRYRITAHVAGDRDFITFYIDE